MATGFIYVVTTVNKDYIQRKFRNVPTEWGYRLYFGPCKQAMRPKVKSGDYVFGISPSKLRPRRVLFTAKIEERITFSEAYIRFPDLRGPEGPIHVCPIQGTGSFPESHYKHIPGSMHENDWQRDLSAHERDAFFVCTERVDWQGRWLGVYGPEVDDEILSFLKTCSVHGASLLSKQNIDATLHRPIAYGGRSIGLHLETNKPEALLELLGARMAAKPNDLDLLPGPQPNSGQSGGTRVQQIIPNMQPCRVRTAHHSANPSCERWCVGRTLQKKVFLFRIIKVLYEGRPSSSGL